MYGVINRIFCEGDVLIPGEHREQHPRRKETLTTDVSSYNRTCNLYLCDKSNGNPPLTSPR